MMKHPIPALGAVAILLVLCSAAAAFDGVSGQEARPPTPVGQKPPNPTISVPAKPNNPAEAITTRVDNDLVKADEGDLDRLYQIPDDPVSHVLAAMALERLHLNLDKASEDAAACEKVLQATRPGIAAYCALFAAGNTRLAGHAQEADRMVLDVAQRYAETMPSTELAALRQLVEAHTGRMDVHVQRLDHTVTVQLRTRSQRDPTRFVEASANGTSRGLMLDTGASWLLLDKRTAHAWGVHMIDEQTQHVRGYFGEDVAASHGVLDRLELDGIVFENVPVDVVAGSPELIGINILKQLGAFRISKEALVIYGGNDTRPACSGPMLAASQRDGSNLWLQHNITIDGSTKTVMLDTGAAMYLSGNAAVKDQYVDGPEGHGWFRDIGIQPVKVGMKVATRDVVIGGQPIKMRFVVFLDDHLPWGYVMGKLALQDMDFYFDFDNRHTCLLLHDKL
jgi:clan AA aspartic protease (TIGR02281 family)